MSVYYKGRGLVVRLSNGLEVGLDCNKGDVNFLSHAHADHVFNRGSNVIASPETFKISVARFNARLERFTGENFGFELLDSGHVLGSKALLIDDGRERVLYTGDFNLRKRHFLQGFKPVNADVLIMDATFSSSDFVFPTFKTVVSSATKLIKQVLNNGCVPCLVGYSFGKAQHLTLLSRRFKKPIFVSDAVFEMNSLHEELGVRINGYSRLNNVREGIVISEKPVEGLFNIGFSGWAVNPGYKYYKGFAEAFPLSDHSDFSELFLTAKKVSPEKVYLINNKSNEISDLLEHEGFEVVNL